MVFLVPFLIYANLIDPLDNLGVSDASLKKFPMSGDYRDIRKWARYLEKMHTNTLLITSSASRRSQSAD